MKRSISNIKDNPSHSRSYSKSPSKSPSRSFMGVKLYNFSQIESYGRIRGPVFTELKRENIKAKLDLQKTVELRYKERLQRNQFFLNYENNPFLVNQQHAKSQVNISIDKNSADYTARRSSRNLVEEFSKIKQSKLRKPKLSKQLKKTQQSASRLSASIQSQVVKTGTAKRLSGAVRQHSKSVMVLKNQEEQGLSCLQFKDIVSIQEASYFKKRDLQVNIFRVLFEKDKTNLLDKYYFDFTSALNSKNKFTPERELTRKARTIVNKIQEPPIHQVADFDHSHLTFGDLMNVVAGRATPKTVYAKIYRVKVRDFQGSSIEDDAQVIYPYGTFNKLIQVSDRELQSQNQIYEYKQQKLEPKEQKYEKQMILRQQLINDQNNLQIQLLRKSIYDENEHQKIKKRVQEQLNSFVDVDYKCPRNAEERNRLIRMRKQVRNRNQVIKLSRLLETVEGRQQQQMRVSDIVSRRL